LALLGVASLLPGCGGGPLRDAGAPGGHADLDAASTGRQLHVSPAGSDANPGTSAQPWRTLQHAADVARPGDTVFVHTGTYAEDVVITRSGTAVAPITFRRAPTEHPLVRRFEFARGAAHLRLIGFRVRGYTNWGVTLMGDNTDIALKGLTITGGGAGIRMTVGYSGQAPQYGSVSDVLIEDCVVRHVQYTAIDGTPGPCDGVTLRRVECYGSGLGGEDSFGADAIGIERGEDLTVEDCYLHDNGGDGIDLNSRDRSGNAEGILVRRNVVARNHLQGIKLWAGGRMERNAVWGQGICPIMIGAYDCTAEVLSNTIAYNMWSADYGARDYAATIGYPESGDGARVALTLRDNLWAFNTGPEVGSPTGLYLGPGVELVEERRSVFFSRIDGEIQADFLGRWFSRGAIRNGTWARLSGQGAEDLCVNPRFVSGWPNVDLHLRPDSPVLGRGAYY
jgi:hypothetical protein